MRKVSEKEHKEWLERYLLGETCRSISKDYPFNENTISKLFKKIKNIFGLSKNFEQN